MLLDDQSSWLREEKGEWILTPLKGENRPESAQLLEEAIAQRLPRLGITDLLIEVDHRTNYTRHLNHASIGTSSQTEQELPYLYASLLAQGGNFSLAQMSRSSGLAHHRLVYMSTWFLHEETLNRPIWASSTTITPSMSVTCGERAPNLPQMGSAFRRRVRTARLAQSYATSATTSELSGVIKSVT